MILTERQLKNFIYRVLNEQEDDEYLHVSPERLNFVIDQVHGHHGFGRIFKNKPLWVDGDLTITNKNLTTLGNIVGVDGNLILSSCQKLSDLGKLKYVKGRFDISHTKIESFDQVEYNEIRTYNSEYENKQLRIIYNEELAEADERRQEGVWDDPNNSEEASEAWGVLRYVLENENDVYELESEEREEKIRLQNRIEELDSLDEMTDEQQEEYDEIEGRLEELENEYIDVYDVLPTDYQHYGFNVYHVKGLGGLRNQNEYAVKRSDDAGESLIEYYKNLIDDVGIDSFSHYVKYNLDGDNVAEDFRDYYHEEIRDNLESYFNNIDYSDEQKERIQELEDYINELDDYIREKEDEQNSLEDEIEEPEEYSKAWDEVQKLIDQAEVNKERAQEEIDEMIPEVSEDMIEDEVESRLDEIRRDPYEFLKDMGYDSKTIANYVDLDEIARDAANDGDYGDMNGYDGKYEEYKIGGDYYIVMRLD